MWKEKSELKKRADNSRDANDRRLFASCLYSIVGFISLGCILKIGYNRWDGTIDPISWTDFCHEIPLLLVISAVIFFITWLRYSFHKEPTTLICLSCGFSKNEFDDTECSCGKNDFRDIKTLEWIDNEVIVEQPKHPNKFKGWDRFMNDIKKNYEIEIKKKEQKNEEKIERQIKKYEKRIKNNNIL